MVMCREIWEIQPRREIVLVGPCSGISSKQFPARIPLSIFAHLTDVRGRNEISLQLVDSNGDVVWQMKDKLVVEEHDPLSPHRVVLRDMMVEFPEPGKFDLEFLVNGAFLAQHSVTARQIKK